MKRSEMITLLKHLFEGNGLVSFGCSTILDEDAVAHDILAAIEEAGMIAPEMEYDNAQNKKADIKLEIEACGDLFFYGWDAE